MERLFMGPGRDDGVEHDLSAGGATSRVELGDRSHPAEEPEPDVAAAAGESSEHWLAGLVRADVLAVTGVGVVLLSMIGLPFLSMMERLTLYIGPMGPFDLSTAWAFAPPLWPAVSPCCSVWPLCDGSADTARRDGCARWRASRRCSAS